MALHSFIQSILSSEADNDAKSSSRPLSLKERQRMVVKLLKKMNCRPEVTDIGGAVNIEFSYQGGVFIIILEKNRSNQLIFPNIVNVPYDRLSVIKSLCNQLNLASEMGRVVYLYNPKSHNVDICILTGLSFDGNSASLETHLHAALQGNFALRETFTRAYEQAIDGQNGERFLSEEEKMELGRELYLLKEQEFARQPASVHQWCEDYRRVELGTFLDKTLETADYLPVSLFIQRFSGRNVTTDYESQAPAIRSCNLLSILIDGEDKEAAFAFDHASLTLSFCDISEADSTSVRQLYIMLQQAGETDNTLYVRATVCVPPYGIYKHTSAVNPRNQVRDCSFLMAYDKVSDRQQRAEFEYMWGDVQDKILRHQTKNLTKEQQFLYGCDESDVAPRIYWGRKYFLQKRYYQALLYLEDTYNALQVRYEQMSSKMLEKFFGVCYMLGFCYTELKQYEKAYFYLDIVASQNNLIYLKAYVNCLVKSGDFRALDVIDGLVERLDDVYDDADEDVVTEQDETTQAFYRFLLQRKVSACINIGELGEAEELCTRMLNDEASKNYALEELARIQKLRRKEGLKTENEE